MLAIAGLGAIGMKVATAVDRGEVPGIRLTAVSARARAEGRVASLPAVVTLAELAGVNFLPEPSASSSAQAAVPRPPGP